MSYVHSVYVMCLGELYTKQLFFIRTCHAERLFSAAEINDLIVDTLGHRYHKEIIPIKNSKECFFLELKSNLNIPLCF